MHIFHLLNYQVLQNIYSKIQGLGFCLGKGFIDFNFLSSIDTTSPFSTSLTKLAPIMSSAQVSEAKI